MSTDLCEHQLALVHPDLLRVSCPQGDKKSVSHSNRDQAKS
jgi:hypothetical protein